MASPDPIRRPLLPATCAPAGAPASSCAAVAAVLACLLAACGGGSDPAAPVPTAPVATPVSAAPTAPTTSTASAPTEILTQAPAGPASNVDANEALALLNAARGSPRNCAGSEVMPAAPPLRWSDALEQAAIAHSEWMQTNDTLSHTGAGGSTAGTRASAAGYVWRAIGENIAAGQPDLAAVIAGWLASPGHCANLMNPNFADAALALKPGTSSNRYRTWWTLMLGRT